MISNCNFLIFLLFIRQETNEKNEQKIKLFRQIEQIDTNIMENKSQSKQYLNVKQTVYEQSSSICQNLTNKMLNNECRRIHIWKYTSILVR